MAWRPDEQVSIESFAVELSRERGVPFAVAEGADPPDAVCRDQVSGTVIAIEHTRVEPRDLASEDRWQQFFQALEALPGDSLPGRFLVGPARIDQRFPTAKRIPLGPTTAKIVDAIVAHPWASSNETWEVSPSCGSAFPPPYWVRAVRTDAAGSEIIPVLPLSHRPLREVIGEFRDALTRKATALAQAAPDAEERILLVDMTHVHPAKIGSLVAHAIDAMEWQRMQDRPLPSAVYMQEADTIGQRRSRRIWPARTQTARTTPLSANATKRRT